MLFSFQWCWLSPLKTIVNYSSDGLRDRFASSISPAVYVMHPLFETVKRTMHPERRMDGGMVVRVRLHNEKNKNKTHNKHMNTHTHSYTCATCTHTPSHSCAIHTYCLSPFTITHSCTPDRKHTCTHAHAHHRPNAHLRHRDILFTLTEFPHVQ